MRSPSVRAMIADTVLLDQQNGVKPRQQIDDGIKMHTPGHTR